MAYSEQYVVPFVAGIHFGTLSGFYAHFRPGTLTINGLDPTDPTSSDKLVNIPQGTTVEIAANTGDPQKDRDAIHIAQGLIQQGRDPWQKPGQQMNLPDERYNQAANFVRKNWLNLPPEEPMQVTSKWHLTQSSEECDLCGHSRDHHEGGRDKCEEQGCSCDRFNESSSLRKSKWRFIQATSADVSSDMSVTSNWKIVALGELQQPGGVGETQGYNPVVDGPNPDGPEIDNAGNSSEQEVAIQTWVNMAVDGLNRGESPEAVLAQLAHDGCPNPEEILQRAQQQPMEEQEPVSDSIGQDPFQAPPPADQTGSMESVSQQPSVLASNANEIGGPIGQPADSASIDNTDESLMKIDNLGKNDDEADLFELNDKSEADNKTPDFEFKKETPIQETKDVHSKRVRIASTNQTGTELDRWEGMWGEGQVKIALDEGGTLTVSPDQVEPVEAEGSSVHPVSEIEQFIANMPKVEPTRPHIEARLKNLETVRRAIRSTISSVDFNDQTTLANIDTEAAAESRLLKEALSNLTEEYEIGYFADQRRFAYNAFDVATPEIEAWAGRPREAGAIWVSENFAVWPGNDSFKQAAVHYASSLGLDEPQFEQFLAGAYENVIIDGRTPPAENVIDHEGPAEALFLS